ncbi:21672_t:CDS:2, partial [Cetraspora pellucida]
AVTIMFASEYPTLTMTVPLYYTLFEMLEEVKKNYNSSFWLVQECDAAKKKLMNYYNKTNVLYLVSVWQINEPNYSNLAKFAQDCLSIPVTSVPSEQVFSISSDMITDKQNRLSKKTV